MGGLGPRGFKASWAWLGPSLLGQVATVTQGGSRGAPCGWGSPGKGFACACCSVTEVVESILFPSSAFPGRGRGSHPIPLTAPVRSLPVSRWPSPLAECALAGWSGQRRDRATATTYHSLGSQDLACSPLLVCSFPPFHLTELRCIAAVKPSRYSTTMADSVISLRQPLHSRPVAAKNQIAEPVRRGRFAGTDWPASKRGPHGCFLSHT